MSRIAVVAAALGLLVLAATGLPAGAQPVGFHALSLPPHSQRPVCGPPRAGAARCHAHVVTADSGAQPLATSTYQYGYAPSDLAAAYRFPLVTGSSWAWNGMSVAIVDANDYPSAESDLAAYRTRFGLPPCTSSNGCFRKVDQRGGTSYPSPNTGWAEEMALDIEMVSAVCPSCKILLVEADSATLNNLGAAVNEAATLGASAISNSYGTSGEFNGETFYEAAYYNHPHVAVTASSGDSGYGVEFPAASQYVTAVGGTSLTRASNARGWSETAWSGAGSGCSAYIPQPSWQAGLGSCSRRSVADVSAVADPNTGVAVYDSFGSSGGANWYVFGGTSVASPIVASMYALAGNVGSSSSPVVYGEYPYTHISYYSSTTGLGDIFDVTSGRNGSCGWRKRYLCTAGPGYDGPTGLGTPDGLAAL